MRITTRAVFDIESGAICALEGYEYHGHVALACGASGQEKAAYGNEQKLSQLLTTQFQQFAGENESILGELTHSLSPIQAAGPGQFGFTPEETAALRTDTAEQLNAANAQTANAVRSAVASRGGGTTYLPSGSEDSILGALAQNSAVKEAEAQSAITAKGYDVGRSNWEFATEGLMKAPGALENPITGAGEAALGGAQAEEKGAQDITAASQAWMQPVGAIIGGVAGGLLPKIPGGKSGGCWILSAVYGKNTPTTKVLWAWLTNEKHGWDERSKIGKLTVWLYYRFGEKAADLVKRYSPIRTLFKNAFDWVLVNKIPNAKWLFQEQV